MAAACLSVSFIVSDLCSVQAQTIIHLVWRVMVPAISVDGTGEIKIVAASEALCGGNGGRLARLQDRASKRRQIAKDVITAGRIHDIALKAAHRTDDIASVLLCVLGHLALSFAWNFVVSLPLRERTMPKILLMMAAAFTVFTAVFPCHLMPKPRTPRKLG